MSDQNQAQISSPPGCAACHGTTTLRKCGRCHVIQYCSLTCQKADWSCHKAHCCRLAGLPWYDLYRQCKDGAKHEGRLEIITWSTPANEHEDFPEAMGWGNVIASEADQLKRKFETDLHGDEAKLYQEWPQAFRWTCCGASGENRFGCDHHGKGSKPCTCDFCRVCSSSRGVDRTSWWVEI